MHDALTALKVQKIVNLKKKKLKVYRRKNKNKNLFLCFFSQWENVNDFNLFRYPVLCPLIFIKRKNLYEFLKFVRWGSLKNNKQWVFSFIWASCLYKYLPKTKFSKKQSQTEQTSSRVPTAFGTVYQVRYACARTIKSF